MTTKLSISYTADEKQRITEALRAAAIAQAEFWDVLRDVEADHACSIEYDGKLLDELAGDCDCPPTFDALKAERVWEAFLQHAELQP